MSSLLGENRTRGQGGNDAFHRSGSFPFTKYIAELSSVMAGIVDSRGGHGRGRGTYNGCNKSE